MIRSRRLATSVKQNVVGSNLFPAIVSEVYNNKVSIMLVGNGQLMTNLSVVGGPVAKGDSVSVDFTTNPPTVLAKGPQSSGLSSIVARSFSLKDGSTSQSIAYLRICLWHNGSIAYTYPTDGDGLADANTAAVSGDIIWIPDFSDQFGPLTLKDGVILTGISPSATELWGALTLGNGCTIQNIKLVNTANDASEIFGLVAQGVGDPSKVLDCEIHCYQEGTGRTNGIKILSDTDKLIVARSLIIADTYGTTSYAFTSLGGICDVIHSRLYGKTDIADADTVNVYGNVEVESEIVDYVGALS